MNPQRNILENHLRMQEYECKYDLKTIDREK